MAGRRGAEEFVGRPRLVFDVHETFPHDLAEFHAPRAMRPLVVGAVRALFRLLVPFTDKLVLAKRSVAVDFPGAEAKQILVQNFVPLRMLARGRRCGPGARPRRPLRPSRRCTSGSSAG